MAVNQIEVLENYAKYLQQTPAEMDALFHDLLIGVTQFFRDADAFQMLQQQIIPRIFANKPAGSTIRVWSTGCSTGEEAYSIAILLQEYVDNLKQNYIIQVFATDIDNHAIAVARAGVYPAGIAADISAERLARFFVAELDGTSYRIHKGIRDMLVFSEQNLIKDPPFSRLDLISCRNLLIYLGAELQQKIIPLFHYALKPNGMLFLGSSEGIGNYADLFDVIDRKAKLYQRKATSHSMQRVTPNRFLPPALDLPRPSPTMSNPKPMAKLPLRELTEQALLQQFAPASALVNQAGDILYLYGRTGPYLELAPGEVGVNNILKMAREGLKRELNLALHQAEQGQEIVRCPNLLVKANGYLTHTNLTVLPLAGRLADSFKIPLFLVTFENINPPELEAIQHDDAKPLLGLEPDVEAHVTALKQDLLAKEEYLQATLEELESANEELKSSNEEMQSVNEELQSSNEELETSKEELQSVNEELSTVNTELHTKVIDLSRANNDMNNLLAGTGIGTVFVDHDTRVLRFTPAASAIINLILSDVGRPIGHIVSNLQNYDQLIPDIQAVLNTLIPKEINVQCTQGTWYTMRIQPYRTLDNVIEGAVISFVDISEMVKIRTDLQIANAQTRLAVVIRDAQDAITLQDMEGKTLAWNPAAVKMYGWSEAEALLINVQERIPSPLRDTELHHLKQLCHSADLTPLLTQRLTKTGSIVDVSVTATALLNSNGAAYAIATTERILDKKAIA